MDFEYSDKCNMARLEMRTLPDFLRGGLASLHFPGGDHHLRAGLDEALRDRFADSP